jgi:hypothetical protein
MKRCEVKVALESPTTKSKIENCFFSQVIFHLLKKEPILLSSDYVQLSEKTFFQCTRDFHINEPNYQQSDNSIYQDEDRFSCQRITMNTINKKFNVTLHQKYSLKLGSSSLKTHHLKITVRSWAVQNILYIVWSISLIICIQVYLYR